MYKNYCNSIIKLNLAIIKTINSCDQKEFIKLINDILLLPEEKLKKIFTKKYYVWNIIRGKDFYKMMTWYVITAIREDNYEHALTILSFTLYTTDRDDIRKNCVKAIVKNVPLLTADTLKYLSAEQVKNIIENKQNKIVADDNVGVLLNKIIELKEHNIALEAIISSETI